MGNTAVFYTGRLVDFQPICIQLVGCHPHNATLFLYIYGSVDYRCRDEGGV